MVIVATRETAMSAANMTQYGMNKNVGLQVVQVPNLPPGNKQTLNEQKAQLMSIFNTPGPRGSTG